MIWTAVLCGFLLDCLLGDPEKMPHPVIWMGKAISRLEKWLRRHLPQTPEGERTGGRILAFTLPVGTLLISGGLCWLFWWIHPLLGLALQILWCWQALAMRCLAKESRNVYRRLKTEGLEAGRNAVARIVGRDTAQLSEQGVIKATVETVAENFSDGVLAPLLYMLIGGAPLALAYKSINTMDSMVGYKNDKYLHFGRAAAKLDDVANYIPSRISALLWIVASPLAGGNLKNAWKIWRRDRRNHASPNSAQTESACAGSLGIQLAGPACYFGKRMEKPYIGDAVREIEPEDILRTNRIMIAASVVGVILGLAIHTAIVFSLVGLHWIL